MADNIKQIEKKIIKKKFARKELCGNVKTRKRFSIMESIRIFLSCAYHSKKSKDKKKQYQSPK